MMQGDRRNGAVLRKRNGSFRSNLCLGRRGVDHEDQRLAGTFAEIDGGADGAQIMRAGTGRNNDQFGHRDDRLDCHGDRRGRIDNRQLEALTAQNLKVGCKARNRCLGESGKLGLALIPPIGE